MPSLSRNHRSEVSREHHKTFLLTLFPGSCPTFEVVHPYLAQADIVPVVAVDQIHPEVAHSVGKVADLLPV